MIEVPLVAPGMEPVADAFRGMLADGREVGAEVAVIRDGKPLLIARGGTIDAEGRPWAAGTLVQVFSAGKPVAAAAALAAVADGALGLDDPIGWHWREYRDDPARPTTLRALLAHRAGKFAFPDSAEGLDPLDQDALIASLAAAEPEYPEGFGSVEHATTYGHLIDGVLRSVGAPSIDRAGAALGDLVGATFRFGVSTAELARVADLTMLDPSWTDAARRSDVCRRALTRPRGVLDPAMLNGDAWRQASFPAIGLHTDAISLARWYDDLGGLFRADRGANPAGAGAPHGALSARLGLALLREAVRGEGLTQDGFSGEVDWGLGVRVDESEVGMGGIGGSAAWYSRRHDYAMAYVTRGLGAHDRVNELADLVEALLS